MPPALVKSLAQQAGTSEERAERLWKEATKAAEEQGRKDDYAYITGIFKRMLGLTSEGVLGEATTSPDYPLLFRVWGPEGAKILLEKSMPDSVRSALMLRFLEFEKQLRRMGDKKKVNWDTLARTLRMAVFTVLNWLSKPERSEESFKKFSGVV
jgi:hypothetical protein